MAPALQGRLSPEAEAARRAALSRNTRDAYASQLKSWMAYSEETGTPSFPASPADVASWLTRRLKAGLPGHRRRRAGYGGISMSTAHVAVAAVVWGHEARELRFDAGHPALTQVLKGLANERAEEPVQSAALTVSVVSAIIKRLLAEGDLAALRDAAIIGLGFSAARRRSELVGLDYERIGNSRDSKCCGTIKRSSTEMQIVLSRSKTGKLNVIVNRDENALAATALDRWIAAAQIETGSPLFRRITRWGTVGENRLSANVVATIVQRRVKEQLMEQQMEPELAEAEAQNYAAHSLRHGFATTAVEAGANAAQIASVTGHRSERVLRVYLEQANKNKLRPSALPGVGLKGD